MPDAPGSVAVTSGNAAEWQRQRGQALARPLGLGVPRQSFCHLGIAQRDSRLRWAGEWGMLSRVPCERRGEGREKVLWLPRPEEHDIVQINYFTARIKYNPLMQQMRMSLSAVM